MVVIDDVDIILGMVVVIVISSSSSSISVQGKKAYRHAGMG